MLQERRTDTPDIANRKSSKDTTTGDATSSPLAPVDPGAESEHRGQPRYCGGAISLTRVTVARSTTSYFAWIHDISEDGIGLEMLGPLGAGVDIVCELKGHGQTDKIRLHAQVIHATRVGPFYRLGCKFTRTLRRSVLTAMVHRIRGA